MYDKLIKHIRQNFSEGSASYNAADAIEQLVAENERLKEIIRKEEWLCRSK